MAEDLIGTYSTSSYILVSISVGELRNNEIRLCQLTLWTFFVVT